MREIQSEETYSPPDEEVILHDQAKEWALSLIDRHNENGQLALLEYNPIKYPFQRLDQSFIKPFRPSEEDIAESGMDELQNRILNIIHYSGVKAMGEPHYEKLVDDLLHMGRTEKFPHNGLKTLWARMHTRNNNSAIVTRHNNLMDTPLVQMALAEAFSKAEFLKEPSYINNFGEFNVFDYFEQNSQTIGFALTRMEYGGTPVVDLLSTACNVQIVMPIEGSRRFGIDRRTIAKYNRSSIEKRRSYIENLSANGLSVLDHIAPAGSTTKKIRDANGNIEALRSDPIDPYYAQAFANEDPYQVPVTVYLNGDQQATKAHVGEPKAVYRGDQVISLMSEMARITEVLSGKKFYECTEEALGSVALKPELLNAERV